MGWGNKDPIVQLKRDARAKSQLEARVAELEQENERLNRRLFPSQGESYANEVERQRVVIDGLQSAAEAAVARAERAEAEYAKLFALTIGPHDPDAAPGAPDDIDALAERAQVVYDKHIRAERDQARGTVAAVEAERDALALRLSMMRAALASLHRWPDGVTGKGMVYASDVLTILVDDASASWEPPAAAVVPIAEPVD